VPKFEDEDEDEAQGKAAIERMDRWRRVFEGEDGEQVLLELLDALHCLSAVPPTQEVIIRQNVGHWILGQLGIMQPGQEHELVRALYSIPPRPPRVADKG
jgi:hypothetical protein